jgi:hypothetical protein
VSNLETPLCTSTTLLEVANDRKKLAGALGLEGTINATDVEIRIEAQSIAIFLTLIILQRVDRIFASGIAGFIRQEITAIPSPPLSRTMADGIKCVKDAALNFSIIVARTSENVSDKF